jgi:hypothetical protein
MFMRPIFGLDLFFKTVTVSNYTIRAARMGPFLIQGGAAPNYIFWCLRWLRCALPLAVKRGVEVADTPGHLERLLAAEAAIRVDACRLPLYWPWALERADRAEARRNGWLGQ